MQTYPSAMPAWLSEGLEICRLHQLSDTLETSGVAKLAEKYGWKIEMRKSYATTMGQWQDYRWDDGGRYLYFISAARMNYGPEKVLKCQIMRQPEPWEIPLPEKEFTSIGAIDGADGTFEIYKPCEECGEAILGQWAWESDGKKMLISAQSNASSTISILITNS